MKKIRDDDVWFEYVERPIAGHGFVRFYRVSCRKCGKTQDIRNTGQANEVLKKYYLKNNWDIGRSKTLHLCPDCAHKKKDRAADTLYEPVPEALPSNVVQLRPPPLPALQVAWQRASKEERADFLLWLESAQGLILAHTAPTPASVPTPDPPGTALYRIIQPGLTHLNFNEIITTSQLLALQAQYISATGVEAFSIRAVDKLAEPTKSEPTEPPSATSMIDEFLDAAKEHAKEYESAPISKVPPIGDDYPQRGTHIDSMPIQPMQPPIEHPVAVTEPVPVPTPEPAQDDDDDTADWWKEIHGTK